MPCETPVCHHQFYVVPPYAQKEQPQKPEVKNCKWPSIQYYYQVGKTDGKWIKNSRTPLKLYQ